MALLLWLEGSLACIYHLQASYLRPRGPATRLSFCMRARSYLSLHNVLPRMWCKLPAMTSAVCPSDVAAGGADCIAAMIDG